MNKGILSRVSLLVFFLFLAMLLLSCSQETSGTSCESDEECPSGQYCGEDKICHKETRPVKDAGFDAGRDAGRDGGKDIESDAIGKEVYEDVIGDAEVDAIEVDATGDIFTDITEDAISDVYGDVEDIGDAVEDVISDVSPDGGEDVSLKVKSSSVYDMSAGIIKAGGYTIRSVTGSSARGVIETKEVKVYNTKKRK